MKVEQTTFGNGLKNVLFMFLSIKKVKFWGSWKLFFIAVQDRNLLNIFLIGAFPHLGCSFPRKISYPWYLCFSVPSKNFWQCCKRKVRDMHGWLWSVLRPLALSEVSGWTGPATLPPQRQMFTGMPSVSNSHWMTASYFLTVSFSLKLRSIINI